jgi:glycosyltransferase involved in cell wall biosynthesis
LNEGANHVGVIDLMAATTFKERFHALTESARLYRLLLARFNHRAPDQAATIRANRTTVITELALSIAVRPALRRLYATWQPSCLISTTDFWPFEHAVFAEARRARIPSFVIQHGVVARFWQPFVCDTLILWGEPFRQELLSLGAPAERLAVCGMPAADQLFLRYGATATRPSIKQTVNFLILSQTNDQGLMPHLYDKYRALLRDVIPRTSEINWVVKLHPSEDDSFYRDIGDDVRRLLTILPKSTTLEQAVTSADVACTLYSTAGLEAMMMGCPVVVLDVEPEISKYAWWPKCGGGVYVPTAEALRTFIAQAGESAAFLDDIVARQRAFLRNAFANHGKAADAVVSLIRGAVEARKPASPYSANI